MPSERLTPPAGSPRLRDGLWTTTARIAHRVGSYNNKAPRTPVGAHPVRDGSWTTTVRIAHRVGFYKKTMAHSSLHGNTHALDT
jgi:hypothetical protein